MKKLIIVLLMVLGAVACKDKVAEDHPHTAGGGHPDEELPALAYTMYSSKSELFVEFKPLVVGQTSKFAAHFTILGEYFLPYTEGTVTVSLVQGEHGIKNTATAPSSPGIFRLALQSTQAGPGKLIFDIQTKEFTDQIIIEDVEVYPGLKEAIAAHPAETGGGDISYLKEQAWKVEFANAPVLKETIFDVVKATGEIVAAPGDEVTVAARSNGVVKFAENNNIAGAPVRSGQALFTVTGGELAFENVSAAKQSANAELTAAQAEYNRTSELIKDKLITQAEYQAAKLRYQNAQIASTNLNKNYSTGGRNLASPINGFINNVLVSEGQYVSSGQPLATIIKNQNLLLRADISLKDADKMRNIKEANFIVLPNKLMYNTADLHGRILSVSKTISNNSPFIPIHFQIDKMPGIIPGSFAEVYLKTIPIFDALAIPVSALIEEQGVFFVYVQTEGESFQKRELRLGANDGVKVQVLSGLKEGERVVTKGGYQIKLSQASGTMPAHGHEH